MVNADDSTAETVEGASGEDEDARTKPIAVWATSGVNNRKPSRRNSSTNDT